MYRGAFDPLPSPLGGGAQEGLNAEQHSRICADLIAAWRTAPLAVLSIDNTGALTFYLGRSGVGTNHPNAPTVVKNSTGNYTVTWSRLHETDDKIEHAWFVRTVVGSAITSGSVTNVSASTIAPNEIIVQARNSISGANSDRGVHLEVYGEWGPPRNISDYGGSLRKRNDTKEHPAPYAAEIYRGLQGQRGDAYTKKSGTFVHVENLTLARFWASVGYRLPEKLQNNASGPRKADEGLAYWARSLGLQQRPTESKEDFRERAAIHRQLSDGATYDGLREAVSTLLGDAFVGITFNHDATFETPPTNTYWPVINPGPDTYDIGGGTWLSERAQILIEAAQPGGMPDSEFQTLMNNDLFELVDRLIPAWTTAQWRDSDAIRVVWDGAGIVWDGAGIVWDQLFDWNS